MNWFKNLFKSTEQPIPAPIVNASKGVKRALLVGINKYQMQGCDLNGCVNDTEDVYDLLVNQYGFPRDNVRVLTDERATKENIIERLNWLVSESKENDIAVWYQSSHGCQLRDRDNGDELLDHMDESLVPHNFSWDYPFLDDEIAELLKPLAQNVYLNIIIDACHSSSSTRNFGNPEGLQDVKAKRVIPPFDIRARAEGRELRIRRFGQKFKDIDTQRHVLLSGCKDDETSEEAVIGGNKTRGAMTYFLTKFLREKANGEDWTNAQKIVQEEISKSGFKQHPQLSGMESLLKMKPFGGKV